MSLLRAARLWALRVAILTYWACRPRLPWAIAEPIVRRRIARAQRSEKAMAYARGQMENLLAATDQASAIEEKAAAFLAFDMTASEMRWNPRKLTRLRLVGIENLIHARSLGRGVVLSFIHHGNFAGMFGAIAKAGVPHGVVSADSILTPYTGPNMRQHIRNVSRGGGLVPASVGTEGMVERLKGGQVLAIATDVPGSSRVPFAGRTASVSSGAAWAATLANSPVVLVSHERDADGPYLLIREPVEPGDFASAGDLLRMIVAHHEGPLLRWPEAAYHPTVCWPVVADEPSGVTGPS